MTEDLTEQFYIPAWTAGDFSTVERWSTGNLKTDLTELQDVLVRVAAGDCCPTDPMWSLHWVAAHLSDLYERLEDQGFRPPPLNYFDDPYSFVERSRRFLLAIEPYVADAKVTVH